MACLRVFYQIISNDDPEYFSNSKIDIFESGRSVGDDIIDSFCIFLYDFINKESILSEKISDIRDDGCTFYFQQYDENLLNTIRNAINGKQIVVQTLHTYEAYINVHSVEIEYEGMDIKEPDCDI